MKKLYKFYVAKDNTLHCESVPVVYENSKYIYYKRHGADALHYVESEFIADRVNLQDLSNKCRQIVKTRTEEDLRFIKEHQFDPRRSAIEYRLKLYRNSIKNLEMDRARYTACIEDLEKQLAELGDKK